MSKVVCVNDGFRGAVFWATDDIIGIILDRGSYLDGIGLWGAPIGISIWEGRYELGWNGHSEDIGGGLRAIGEFRKPTEMEWDNIKAGKGLP